MYDLRDCSAYSFLVVLSSAAGGFLMRCAEGWRGILGRSPEPAVCTALLSPVLCHVDASCSGLSDPQLGLLSLETPGLCLVPCACGMAWEPSPGSEVGEQQGSIPLRDYHPVLLYVRCLKTTVAYILFRFLVV